MLSFQRNKLVTIVKKDNSLIAIHGVLEDHIFGLELDVTIGLDDLKIHAIEGKWNRQETPECQRAVPFLQEAVGYQIDDHDLGRQINKLVGRKSCPHFANLLIECCDAAADAVQMLKWEEAKKDQPELAFERYLEDRVGTAVEKKPAASTISVEADHPEEPAVSPSIQKRNSDGFTVDLHMHSFPASPCSSARVDQLVQEAKRIGLDAICLTDHNHVWAPEETMDLTQKHGFLVLRGNEITTDQGDMLVFGMYQDIRGIIKLAELKQLVDASKGFMIAAHPFRGFLVFNTSQIGLTVEKAMERPALRQVHAIEILNGKVTEQENAFAKTVAAGLNLPATGGSDAHDVFDVGKYATRFFQSIKNEDDLLAAMKRGAFEPYAHRSHKTGTEYTIL
jgi:predicted metal-dependent phosphoesterase TrpH